jgi:hypothetical protein
MWAKRGLLPGANPTGRAGPSVDLTALRGVVGFDWYAFVLTDPQTMVGGALADVPAALLPSCPG